MSQDPRKRNILLSEDADGDDSMDVDEVMPTSTSEVAPQQPVPVGSSELLSRIITPSPFPQHNSGTSRFRNALQRVNTDYFDTEAWQAVMTEVTSCYMSIKDKTNSDHFAKLDWVESCYGALLSRFPFSTQHIVRIAEILMDQLSEIATAQQQTQVQHALFAAATAQRYQLCQAKLDRLFEVHLGVSEASDSLPLCSWVVDLWLIYIRKVEADAVREAPPGVDARADHIQQARLIAFDRAVQHAGSSHNNHILWRKYLDYVKSWQIAPTDHARLQKQMLQLRSIYQRLVVHPMTGLDQFWQEYEAFEKQQSEALAAALIQEYHPKYNHARTVYLERNRVLKESELQLGRLASPPVSNKVVADENDADFRGKLRDEYHLLRAWKTRSSYERTNPGRLSTHDLTARIRSVFQEMACTLTRHPEAWHMWARWELLLGGPTGNDYTGMPPAAQKAVRVLQVAQVYIPDSTLLAYAETQILEAHVGAQCCTVMEKFLERSPNSLGFVLYQQLVRRYQGPEKARAVFSRARRTLQTKVVETSENSEAKEGGETAEGGKLQKEEENGANKWMVTNRLDASIGKDTPETVAVPSNGSSVEVGVITWHLYASHAVMEHRLNRNLEVAARIYELGLRKHASFLTVPAYIRRYANLLLELNDTTNLRALLTRAVSACEAEEKRGALVALCDLMLLVESVTACDAASVANIEKIEKRRREALLGADVEDVATGGLIRGADGVLIGAQKSTISDQLIRTEGYDVSSSIINGLSRTVDMLGAAGILGSGESTVVSDEPDDNVGFSGGKSDQGFLRRVDFQKLTEGGISKSGMDVASSRGSSVRERLAGAGATGGPQGGTAIMMTIQQSPEWLRPLLLLLPASRLRIPIVAKAPPHLIEMALSTIRQNALPAERPPDDVRGVKRSRTGGDSSDEEDAAGSGYGNAFRNRQRSRMTQNGV